MSTLKDSRIAAVHQPDYGDRLPGQLERAAGLLGWASDAGGPFGSIIAPGSRVLIKPNWVSHANQGDGGFTPLVTQGAVVRAVTEAVLRSGAGAVRVGDAPLQSCNFSELLERSGLRQWAEDLVARDRRFEGLHDFRRTISTVDDGVRHAREDQRSLDQFVLFDLAGDSLLEPVTEPGRFRVTQYDPALMDRTHAPGTHRYLVARDVMEADVIINLPKLKTHKKAGITCALKNLIGINGNKEFLPHHRTGGSAEGGDCYPGSNRAKRALERTLDLQNSVRSTALAASLNTAVRVFDRFARQGGDELGVEGSWSGNDTIWRTCLDLNRILLYGQPDAGMAEQPRRQVLHIVDAIMAGQGDGPLSPQPLPLGLLLAGSSAAAMDYVGSLLLGYDAHRIPITRESFGEFRWPLAVFGPDDVMLAGDLGSGSAQRILERAGADTVHPAGWVDAARDESALR